MANTSAIELDPNKQGGSDSVVDTSKKNEVRYYWYRLDCRCTHRKP